MATQVQFRGGTTAQNNAFTGASKELTVDTDKDVVVVHDGATAGGHPLMAEDGSNSALANGSVTAPALKFASGQTGIYSAGSNQLSITTNGNERVVFNSSGATSFNGMRTMLTDSTKGVELSNDGAVEIWRNDSSAFIDFKTNTGEDYDCRIQQNNNGLAFNTGGQGLASQKLFISSGGNVGIGTSSPATPLHVDTTVATPVVIESSNSQSLINFRNSSTSLFYMGATSNNWNVQTNGVERLSVTTGGNVGIGTTNPQYPLDVAGNIRFGATDGYAYIQYGLDSTATDNWHVGTEGDGSFRFYNGNLGSGSEKMRIDSSGRLLINTSTSRTNLVNGTLAAQLQVEGTNHVASSGSFIRNANDGNNAFLTLGKTRGTANGSNTIVQNGDGLGTLAFLGADGTNLIRAAEISAQVDGTPGANDMPGRLVLATTADGASSPTERMTIKNDGTINFANVQTFADDAAAGSGGLVSGDVYKTSAGDLKIKA